MIEMLGVLAIIGVLSAGGIMGYSVAMENYKVNKFIADILLIYGGAADLIAKDKTKTGISSTKLCSAKIIPEEYCKSLSSEYVDTPIGERVHIKMAYYSVGYRLYVWSYVRNTGETYMSAKNCVKLLTYDWKLGTKNLPVAYFYPANIFVSLPKTHQRAEELCFNSASSNQVSFYFPYDLK